MQGKLCRSLHLLVDRERLISEVHALAEEPGSRLRLDFPQFERIVIHTEPAAMSSTGM
jgi:divalent metal cation (Fe/Co/Zn/Cd) transporter